MHVLQAIAVSDATQRAFRRTDRVARSTERMPEPCQKRDFRRLRRDSHVLVQKRQMNGIHTSEITPNHTSNGRPSFQ